MTITSWRLVKKKYAASAFDGEGARLFGGRWNSAGVPAIYTAESISLAILETLAREEPSLAPSYCVIPVKFNSALVEAVAASSLPLNWDAYPAPAAVVSIGDQWLRAERSAVLKVPSAIVAREFNYIINPSHPDFALVSVGSPEDFEINPRLK